MPMTVAILLSIWLASLTAADPRALLLLTLGAVTVAYVLFWGLAIKGTWGATNAISSSEALVHLPAQAGVGFFANFMDTLGVGSFAITSSLYKLFKSIPDDQIPGTLNVGHALPTITEAFIFVAVIQVEFKTLISMIIAAVLGAWFGAGIVSGWPKRKIQIGLGIALFAAALLMLSSLVNLIPAGGDDLGLSGAKFWIAVAANFMFAVFQQLGVGLYAPCMILIYFLGMNQKAAFPIMMGSCAFLMPVAGVRFIRSLRYSPKAALGLTLGGIPGVLLAAYVVKSLPLTYVKWLVVFVVLYTSVMLLRSASQEKAAALAVPVGHD